MKISVWRVSWRGAHRERVNLHFRSGWTPARLVLLGVPAARRNRSGEFAGHTNARPWTKAVQNTEIENLLPDNLLVLNRDIGALKGQGHTHTSG